MFLGLTVGSIIEPLTGRRWTPQDIMRRCARRVSSFRRHGMTPSDRVFIHFGNSPEFFVDLLAVWSLGGCAIPIDTRLTPFEVATLARWAAPRFSLWQAVPESQTADRLSEFGTQALTSLDEDGDSDGALHPWDPALHLDQDALILFTSGTTGQPKGVIHTHRSLRAQWMNLRHCLGVKTFRRSLCLLPTHFGHGLICNSLFPWLFGQDLYIVPPFKPDLLGQLGALLDEHQITFMSSVPAIWRLVLKLAPPPRARTLERVFCGSAPLSAALWKAILEWTSAGRVLNVYGITETASWLAGTTMPEFAIEDGLIGIPWGTVIKVVNRKDPAALMRPDDECAPGESGYVWVSTPALMRGYVGRDDWTNQAVSQGWFLTGDIGTVDEQGLLYLRGRERDEINKGGTKVSPGDVDAVVEHFDHTIDVCTFGYDDPLYGENVGIAVVLHSPDDTTLRRLYSWANEHLAKHQMPQRWYLLAEMPRSSRGKINRAAVAEHCRRRPAIGLRSLSGPGSRSAHREESTLA